MKYVLFLIGIGLFLSCGGDRLPADILPQQQMETIIWQLAQVDEFAVTAFMGDSTKNVNTERIRRYRQVFLLNHTSKEVFEKSYTYYMAHPDVTRVMLDSITIRASRRTDTAAVTHPHPGPVIPSGINKLKFKPATAPGK